MNFENLNKWLTLIGNLGVLAGIIFLGFEVQQARTALIGEYHANRADRSNDIGLFFTENRLDLTFQKYSEGAELTADDRNVMSGWSGLLLRHFEDIQFQRNLGLVDDEVWESSLRGMRVLVDSPAFRVVHADWPNSSASIESFRTSFVELIGEFKAELE